MRLLNNSGAEERQSSKEYHGETSVLKHLALALINEVQSLEENHAIDIGEGIDFYDEVRRFEIDLILRALEQTGGHQSRAARLLGMNATPLNSKIKTYNIQHRTERGTGGLRL